MSTTAEMPQNVSSAVGNDAKGVASSACFFLNLPDDVLCLILEHAADAEPPHYMPYHSRIPFRYPPSNKALGFLRLSEVCRRIRNALLSMPVIWAGAVFLLPERPARIALERSQHALLAVNLRPRRSNHVNKDVSGGRLVEMVIEHNTRLSSIAANTLTEEAYAGIFKGQTLILLKSIELKESAIRPLRAVENICVNAPNLRGASLSGLIEQCYFVAQGTRPGLSFKLPSLVSLDVTISDAPRSHRSGVDLAWFVDVLVNSPLIEVLAVDLRNNRRFMEWKAVFAAGREVKLSQLRSIRVYGGFSTRMATFINQVSLNTLSQCSVSFLERGSESADDPEFIEAFRPRLSRPCYDNLYMGFFGQMTCAIFQITAFSSSTYPGPHHHLDLLHTVNKAARIVSFYAKNNHFHDQVVNVCATSLQHTFATRIILDVRVSGWWPNFLRTIFLSCTRITELVVQRLWREPELLFSTLLAPDLLPSLETLFIRPVMYTQNDEKMFDIWWESFARCLQLRDEAGRRIRRLRLFGPTYPSSADEERAIDGKKCANVAAYVDELLDERAGDVGVYAVMDLVQSVWSTVPM